MPWLLNTPILVGDLDPAGPYTHVNITRFNFDDENSAIFISWKFGVINNNNFVPGFNPKNKETSYVFREQEYLDLINHDVPEGITKTYLSVKSGLYDALVNKGLIDAGTLV